MQSVVKVSVVMCTYNGVQFINEQIDTILKQDYPIYELIIVDDRSIDDTWNRLLDWQKKDDRIQLYQNEQNLGYNKNFEKAIGLTTGDVIAIADQDDIWMPAKIRKQVESLQFPEVLLSHTRSVRLQNGRLRYKSASLHHHYKGNDTSKLFMFNQINGHDMMFKKELIPKFMPVPEGMMYDWWIAINATCYGTIASIDEFLVHHRIHDHNSFFTGKRQSIGQPDLIEFLGMFATIPVLHVKDRNFLSELIQQIKRHNHYHPGSFDKTFFKFLYKNGNILFGHKKRWIPLLNYFKSAMKYARMDYKGRGISI